MTLPLLPSFLTGLGASLSFAGLFVGLFSFVALVGRPFASIMGDRLNKKWLLGVFLFLNGFFTLIYIFAPSVMWMLPIRVLHGLAFSVSGTIIFALGAEFIPKQRIGEGIGFLGIGQIIGMAVGPNIGINIVELHSYQLNFIIGGAMVMAAGLSLAAMKYKHSAPPPQEKRALHLQDFLAVELLPNVIFVAIFTLGMGLINAYLVLFGYARGIGNIGLYFIVNAIIVLLSRPLLGRMTDRKGVSAMILPGYILAAIALVLIGSAYSIWPILIAAVLFAIGAGGSMPAIQTDCLQRLDVTRRTVATGTYMIGLDIGMTIGQVFGGTAFDTFGFDITFYATGALMVVGFGFYLGYIKRLRRLGKW